MLARAVPCVPIIITIVIVACHLQPAGRQASKQARRQCVRDSILQQRVQSRFVSSSSQRSLPRRPRLRSSIDYCSPCSASSTKGRSASSRLLSPDLHLGGSQRAREPEYLSTQRRTSALFFPASSSETTAAHLNPRPPRQDTARRTRLHI